MSDACETQPSDATPEEIRAILRETKVVAVVGLSDRPDRASYQVAAYLQAAGYRVIPVNPAVSEVLGEKAYASLRDVPGPIDLVDVFRKSEAVPEVVEDAVAVGAKAVWMQEGVVHHAAAGRARAAGLRVVMNRCVLKEHAAIR
jgi:predicted CoA-binding protein